MSALRLLLVTDALGGVWVYSLELARALRPLGVETVLAVLGPEPNTAQRAEAAEFELVATGLPLDWLDTSPVELRRAGEALAALADLKGADVVQTSSAALLADARFDQPCVAVQHSCVATWWAAVKGTPLPEDFRWRRELVECGLNRAAAVVAPSIAFAAETARAYDLSVHVQPVHNGKRNAVPAALPYGHFAFTAGRLWDEGKNAATLDRAAESLNAPFQAAGGVHGPNGAMIELGHLRELGELSAARIGSLFAARPVYASASLYEPFGLSVLEAAQAGCALVLSDISAHREMWDGAAIFVEARDDRAFASAIGDLLDDFDEREQLGQLARARAQHYSAERMARAMSSIYARVTEDRAVASMPTLAGAA
ncbi:MAG TPA: glycosyltransferase family 4 protein [Sphingomicrobium sp.]|nr:glycosyltransferase family 4 protein [Sphingomicrobium sp.]